MNRALVISGGGSKGAYAVGVLKQLQKDFPRLNYDVLVGTSTGSLIVPLVATGDLALLEKIYTSQTENSIVRKLRIGDRLNTDSIFDANPLWEMVQKHFDDAVYNKIQASGKKIYLNTVCLQTEELVVFTNDTDAVSPAAYTVRLLENANHFRRAVMASACQPVFMPTIQVNRDIPGHPEKDYQYVDGGLRQWAGIEMAINAGSAEIFTILLSSDATVVPRAAQFKDLFSILERTIEIFTTDVGKNDLIVPQQFNEALEYIQAVKNKMTRAGLSKQEIDNFFFIRGRENPFEEKVPLKLFTFRPDAPLGGGPGGLDFNKDEMTNMIRLGQRSGVEFAARLSQADVTWA